MKSFRWGLAIGVMTLSAAACEQGSDLVGVTGSSAFSPAFLAVGDEISVGELWVCKNGPAGTYSFTVATTSGTMNYTGAVDGTGAFTVDAGACKLIVDNKLVDPAPAGPFYDRGTADVTEVGLPANVLFKDVVRYRFAGTLTSNTGVPILENPPGAVLTTTIGTERVGPDNGRLLLFTNIPAPPTGCTLTQGYWKTHNNSFKGGAPTNDTWNMVGASAEGTTFFLSGKSWFDVFWTAPAGNAYYNLAHQYMAARLNVYAGAAVPAGVATAINSATTLFGTWTPATIGALKGNNADRANFIALAGILATYNEGAAGPDHCGA